MRALPLATLALLAGCATDQNMTVNSIHQPTVATRDWTLALSGDALGLAPGEAQRLAGFLAGIDLAPGDRVATDAPAGPVRDAVAQEVGTRGLLLASDPPAGPPAASGWRVTVSRSTASVPGCPDWGQAQVPQAAPAASRNYGCASNANLAAMLADPMDLLRGRSAAGQIDPRTSVKAIGAWRDAKPTGEAGLKVEKAGGGSK